MREKINSLQGLRVISMIIIFLYNCELFPFGHLAVTFFFILSGVVSYYSNDKIQNISLSSSIKYYKNKIKKFYLVYLLTIILGLIVNYTVFSRYNLSKKILIILSNVTLTQAFIPNSDYYFSLNGVGWYLSSLVFCYLVFNMYNYYLNKINISPIIIIVTLWVIQALISLAIINLSYDTTQWIIYINPIMRSINFLMGMLLAKIFINKRQKNITEDINYSKFEIIICVLFVVIYINSVFIPRAFIWSVYYSPIIMLIIYIFSFEKGAISKILGKNIFVKLSAVSFEFYMIHQLIINICWNVIRYNRLIIAFSAIIISIILAVLLNKFSKLLKSIRLNSELISKNI